MNYIKINLSHNQFKQVKIYEIELYLNNNQLTSIPAEIGKLQNLQKLDLSNNQLTSIPAEIGQLQSLQILNLYNNQLTSIPAEIGQLQKLQKLYLYNNQFNINSGRDRTITKITIFIFKL